MPKENQLILTPLIIILMCRFSQTLRLLKTMAGAESHLANVV